jgi:hypothetical protein
MLISRWEAPEVRSLVCEEPLVLLLPAAAVGNRWRRLQQAAQPRAEWKQLVRDGRGGCAQLRLLGDTHWLQFFLVMQRCRSTL